MAAPNLLAALLAALTGHAQPAPPPAPAQVPAQMLRKPRLDPVYSFSVTRFGVIVVVPSNGCTRKEDFAARTSGPGRNAVIGFYRRRLDMCRSFAPGHAELRYGFQELALSPNVTLKLLNGVTADPSPGVR
jgi:hypothetical protein